MTRVQKRKYEKIDEAEIDLVIQCSDSHEFYERYREAFPTRKKGIDSISKIWKRRGEFIKRRQESSGSPTITPGSGHELENLLNVQNEILRELVSLTKEQLKVSREIAARLPKPGQKIDEPSHKHAEIKIHEHKEPVKKPEKSAEIMIGS